uniref:Uncharacterized protein n=1 Tax=Rhizophora mucronata TaxID=61149 RepID=A0A2P2Q0K8_RHIMU
MISWASHFVAYLVLFGLCLKESHGSILGYTSF